MCVSFLISSKFPVRLNLYFFLVNAYTPHIVPLSYNPTGNSTNSYVALLYMQYTTNYASLTLILFYDCCMQYTYSALWLLYAIHHKPSLTHIFPWLLYAMHLYYSVTAVCNTPQTNLCHLCLILFHSPPHIYAAILQNTSTLPLTFHIKNTQKPLVR